MRCGDGGGDAATHLPDGFDRHASGHRGPEQIVEDLIGDCLVERSLIAVAPQVHLETLQFDEKLVGYVGDSNRGEIGLACHGAKAGHLIGFTHDFVVSTRLGVRDRDEVFGRLAKHEFSALAEDAKWRLRQMGGAERLSRGQRLAWCRGWPAYGGRSCGASRFAST